MITSENIVLQTQFKNFSISWKSHVLFVRYSICYFSNNFINFESCDVAMNIIIRGKVCLLNQMSFGYESRSTDRYSHLRYLQEIFCRYDEMGPKSWHFSICKCTTSDHKLIMMSQ